MYPLPARNREGIRERRREKKSEVSGELVQSGADQRRRNRATHNQTANTGHIKLEYIIRGAVFNGGIHVGTITNN